MLTTMKMALNKRPSHRSQSDYLNTKKVWWFTSTGKWSRLVW